MDAFQAAVCFVLDAEGGQSNDPDDPGGLTRYGIAQASHPDVDVYHLTERAAIDLYRAQYWDPLHLDLLPSRIAVAVFDGAVQHGLRPSVRMLQDSVGTEPDGKLGPITVAATQHRGGMDTLVGYCARRAVYYGHLPTFWKFGLGWNQRLLRLLLYTQSV